MNLLATYTNPLIAALSILVLALLAVTLWQVRHMRRLERHYQSLVAGTDGGSLQAVLDCHMEELRAAVSLVRELEMRTLALERAGRQHVQHVTLRRYNPFRETGGDQSFVLSMTDADGNGAVVTSMHSRDVTRVYAKPLTGWTSSYPLTEEEKSSLNQARQ